MWRRSRTVTVYTITDSIRKRVVEVSWALQRLEGFLRRGCRQNLYSTDKPYITQIVEADENFFNSIRYNTSHLLHQLLPRRTENSYSLRSRPRKFELSHIHDDRNFIDRMLFYPYHNA